MAQRKPRHVFGHALKRSCEQELSIRLVDTKTWMWFSAGNGTSKKKFFFFLRQHIVNMYDAVDVCWRWRKQNVKTSVIHFFPAPCVHASRLPPDLYIKSSCFLTFLPPTHTCTPVSACNRLWAFFRGGRQLLKFWLWDDQCYPVAMFGQFIHPDNRFVFIMEVWSAQTQLLNHLTCYVTYPQYEGWGG